MCTAAAAVVPGSIVEQVLRKEADTQYLRIGHAGGTLECGVDYREESGKTLVIEDTFGFCTANLFTGWRGVSQNLTGEKDVPAP